MDLSGRFCGSIFVSLVSIGIPVTTSELSPSGLGSKVIKLDQVVPKALTKKRWEKKKTFVETMTKWSGFFTAGS